MNRTYNPGQSRFTQVDPIGMGDSSLVNPQSLNLFAYVRNNPVDFVDPSGLNLSATQYSCTTTRVWGHWEDGNGNITGYASYSSTTCQEVGGGGGGGGRAQSKQKEKGRKKAEFSWEQLNKCLDKFFGAKVNTDGNGNPILGIASNGWALSVNLGGKDIGVWTSFEEDSTQLGKRESASVPEQWDGRKQSGFTPGTDPTNNFIASDVVRSLNVTGIGVLAVWVHELGNAVGGQQFKDAYGKARTQSERDALRSPWKGYKKTDMGDSDVGSAFERCVFGGIVGLQSGKVGNSREFSTSDL